jgi:hypothetical protein
MAGLAGPALAATRPDARENQHELSHDESGEQVVAHVRDARTGEIELLRGTSQIVLHDRALAARLIRASR